MPVHLLTRLTPRYTSGVEASTASSFYGKTGVQPGSAIGGSGIIVEDLYAATTSSAYTYEGYFTFNYNTDSLTFTSAAVPEPSSIGLMAAGGGLGLLALIKRRKTSPQNI